MNKIVSIDRDDAAPVGTDVVLQPVSMPQAARRHFLDFQVMGCRPTLQEIVDRLPPTIRGKVSVTLQTARGEWGVPRAHWPRVRPRAGVTVLLDFCPEGGGGSKVLRTVFSIAIMVAAFYAAPALGASIFGSALVNAGLSVGLSVGTSIALQTALAAGLIVGVGFLALNALIPVKAPQIDSAGESPTTSSGLSNQLRPGSPVPIVLGKVRYFPPMAAASYMQTRGSDRYQVSLLDFGYGPLEISDIRIGDTPLKEYEDVDLEVLQGWDDDPDPKLYSNDVTTDSYGLTLEPGVEQIVTTQANIDAAELDIFFPEGLIKRNDKGKKSTKAVSVTIQWRKVGNVTWNNITTVYSSTGGTTYWPWYNFFGGNVYIPDDFGSPITSSGSAQHSFAAQTDYPRAFQKSISFPARGQYEIRLVRQTAASTDDKIKDKTQLLEIRSIKNDPPIRKKGTARLAIKIRVTDQSGGAFSNINAMVQRLYPYWDDVNQVWIDPKDTRDMAAGPAKDARMANHRTRAAAAAFCYLARGAPSKYKMPDNRLDMTSIYSWWQDCEAIDSRTAAAKFYYDKVIEQKTNMADLLTEICSVGRAVRDGYGGKLGVVRDVVQAEPRGMFTARNTRGLSGSFILKEMPHAFRVLYGDEDQEYQETAVIVYADGHDELTAKVIEDLPAAGITRKEAAWTYGRYYLANLQLRPEVISFRAGIDAYNVRKGDYVVLNHDVPRHGLSVGKIAGIETDGSGDVTAITLDEYCQIESGKTYSVAIRRPIPVAIVMTAAVKTVAGETRRLEFVTPIAAASSPAVGDLVSFGETDKEVRDVVVKEINPIDDLEFEMTVVDRAPAIQDADTDSIPPFDPQISYNPDTSAPAPVLGLTLTENIVVEAGQYKSEVVVTWRAAPGRAAETYEVYEEDPNGLYPLLGITRDEIYKVPYPLVAGESIKIRVLSVSPTGIKLPKRLASSATLILDGLQDVPGDITGLRLVGGLDAATFEGPSPSFAWDGSSNLIFDHYKVEIYDATTPASPILLRTVTPKEPGYTYDYKSNKADSGGAAVRDLRISVVEVDANGAESVTPTILDVTNPLPAVPTVTTEKTDSFIYVSFDRPGEADWDSVLIWKSTTSPVDLNADLVYSGRETLITIPADPNTQYYLRIGVTDTFNNDYQAGAEIGVLTNPEPVFDTTQYDFEAITFAANSPTADRITWTAGSAIITEGSTVTTKSITSGQADWTSGTIYVYYNKGETILRSTTNLATATGQSKRILAVYKGGSDMQVNLGKVLIDGDTILAGTIGANQLSTGLLITDAAQIGNGVITNASIAGIIQSDNWNSITKQGWQLDKSGLIQGNALKIYAPDGSVMIDATADNRADFINSGIVLNPDGTLSYTDGAGNPVNLGATTLPGLGAGDLATLNSFPSLTLVTTDGSTSIAGNRITFGTNSGWANSAYTEEFYVGSALISFTPDQTNGRCMVGLGSNPTASNSWENLDYAWYCYIDGTLQIRESGSGDVLGTNEPYSTTTLLQIVYDGVDIIYYKDGVEKRRVNVGGGLKFHLDTSGWSTPEYRSSHNLAMFLHRSALFFA